jgi:uncharacterized protein YgiM (DUF1202 family)
MLLSIFMFCKEPPKQSGPIAESDNSTARVLRERLGGYAETVDEIFYNHAKDGLNIRSSYMTDSPKIGVLPYKARVKVIESWVNPQLVDSESQWYRIKYGNIDGWVSGMYLSSWPPDTDYSQFKSGCLYGHCDMCPVLHFLPDNSFKMSIGCHYGWGNGKWWIEPDGIHADVTLTPTCYDFCMEWAKSQNITKYEEAKKQFELTHTHTVHLRFFQTKTGAIDFEATRPSKPNSFESDLPKKPLGRMIPYRGSP